MSPEYSCSLQELNIQLPLHPAHQAFLSSSSISPFGSPTAWLDQEAALVGAEMRVK